MSNAWRILLRRGRRIEPLTADSTAIVARAFGRCTDAEQEEFWRNLTTIERLDLKAWSKRRQGMSMEARLAAENLL